MSFKAKIVLLITALMISACTPFGNQTKRETNLEEMIPCPKERPVSCKEESEPVCGVFSNGGSFNYESKCIACTRRTIVGYIPGACPR